MPVVSSILAAGLTAWYLAPNDFPYGKQEGVRAGPPAARHLGMVTLPRGAGPGRCWRWPPGDWHPTGTTMTGRPASRSSSEVQMATLPRSAGPQRP